MADGVMNRFGKWLLPSQTDGCMPRNMLLATAFCLWGYLFVYGFAHFNIGYKPAYKIPGGIFLILSFILSALYLHQYFRRRSMTYWGSGLALLLAVAPLHLTLSTGDPDICHASTAKWIVLALAFTGGPLLLFGLFHLVERGAEAQRTSNANANTDADADVNVNQLTLSLLFLLVFHLTGGDASKTDAHAAEVRWVDKEELKNFTLLLILFLSLFIFGRQFIVKCWSS